MGDYIYERFTPDRFQDFVSALLVKEFPHYQVFPVGQKDGGRDGRMTADERSMIVQVKFKRELKAGENYASYIISSLEKELPKVKRLVDRGAKEYLLVTNVPGSAALDTGAMDKVQEYLASSFPIPAKCFWRADLDARLAGNYDLKWFYSEVLATPDVVRELLTAGLGEERERRFTAVTGYLRSQYESDAFVKFKQAELQASDLLNLFVDVPGRLDLTKGKSMLQGAGALRAMLSDVASHHRDMWHQRRDLLMRSASDRVTSLPLPAGSLVLHSAFVAQFPRVVVEGAPGQGKSTLVQYLCQVHRMRFLDRAVELDRIPGHHRLSPIRVPFKIDLRDLSQWLEGYNHRKAREKHDQPPTLETFIASEVSYLSGGQRFDGSDLHLLAKSSPLLIVLDGFDEVATPEQRFDIIREVDRALARLSEDALSIQALVTSRPSVLPDSPRFSHGWQYLALASITKPLALEYAQRWSHARRLEVAERDEVLSILSQKLETPHLRDLARNPMQLTILLALIHLRGQSLPDQRTSMYSSYIEVFFNREAEKTAVVRDYRQLLIDLHGFLAWTLHADAESSGSDGRITTGALKATIATYLREREYPDHVIESLFEGVVQRIVALVSRIEGTFEFEVQPLREYFAAHHLYHTSPYSPPGQPVSGTKPEILTALIDNPYWHNVLRFFAGFYSAGELPGLADELIQRIEATAMPSPLYHRQLAVNLLTDWVFHQSPVWTRKLVEASGDGLMLRMAVDEDDPWASANFRVDLPAECGGTQYGMRALHEIPNALSLRTAVGLADAAHRHLDLHTVSEAWWGWVSESGESQARPLLFLGVRLGVLSTLNKKQVDDLVARWNGVSDLDVWLRLHGVSPDVGAAKTATLIDRAVDLELPLNEYGGTSPLSWAVHPYRLCGLLEEYGVFLAIHSDTEMNGRLQFESGDGPFDGFIDYFRQGAEDGLAFRTALEPWQGAIDLLQTARGSTMLGRALACVAAGVISTGERGAGASDLFDETQPITNRYRYGRLRGGQPLWWGKQLSSAETDDDWHAWAMLCFTWASGAVQNGYSDDLDRALASMSIDRYLAVSEWVVRIRRSAGRSAKDLVSAVSGPVGPDSFRRYVMYGKLGVPGSREKVLRWAKSQGEFPEWALGDLLDWTIEGLPERPSAGQWRRFFEALTTLHGDTCLVPTNRWDAPRGRGAGARSFEHLSLPTSRSVARHALRMPLLAVRAAESRLSAGATGTPPLAVVAELEGWRV